MNDLIQVSATVLLKVERIQNKSMNIDHNEWYFYQSGMFLWIYLSNDSNKLGDSKDIKKQMWSFV